MPNKRHLYLTVYFHGIEFTTGKWNNRVEVSVTIREYMYGNGTALATSVAFYVRTQKQTCTQSMVSILRSYMHHASPFCKNFHSQGCVRQILNRLWKKVHIPSLHKMINYISIRYNYWCMRFWNLLMVTIEIGRFTFLHAA